MPRERVGPPGPREEDLARVAEGAEVVDVRGRRRAGPGPPAPLVVLVRRAAARDQPEVVAEEARDDGAEDRARQEQRAQQALRVEQVVDDDAARRGDGRVAEVERRAHQLLRVDDVPQEQGGAGRAVGQEQRVAREEEQEPPVVLLAHRVVHPGAEVVEARDDAPRRAAELGARRLGDAGRRARPARLVEAAVVRVVVVLRERRGVDDVARRRGARLGPGPQAEQHERQRGRPVVRPERGAGHARVHVGDREAVAAADQEQVQELQHGVRLVAQVRGAARAPARADAGPQEPLRRVEEPVRDLREAPVALRLDARHEEQRRGRRAVAREQAGLQEREPHGFYGRSGMLRCE